MGLLQGYIAGVEWRSFFVIGAVEIVDVVDVVDIVDTVDAVDIVDAVGSVDNAADSNHHLFPVVFP